MMMPSSHGGMILPHTHQQNPNQMMGMYNQNNQQQQQGSMMGQPPHPGMMSHSPHPPPHPAPGMSPHPPQPMMGQYPQQGISPHPGQQVPINGHPPPHNMIQNIHNQMLPNNPQSRVMSPQQQGNSGIMSPHHQMMNQGGPPGQPGPPQSHHQQNMMQMQQGNGPPLPPGMSRGNMMPPHPMNPNMMPHPHHPQHPHAGIMSPHNNNNNNNPNMMMNPHQHSGPQGMMGPPQNHPGGRIYPPNQPVVPNPQNPNAPPIHPCGVCHREVQGDSEEGLMCESGCNFWFHRICINMSPDAYHFIKTEVYAEWVCDNCIQTKRIAPIKFKS